MIAVARYKKGVDGNYRASIVIGRTSSGGQRRKTVKAKTVRELERKLAELKERYNRGMDFDAAKATVGQWADRWIELYKKPTVGASTIENTRSILNKHILPRIGHLAVGDVRQFQLQEIMNLQSGKSKSNTVKIHGVLKQMFDKAKQGGLSPDNPAEFLEIPKTVTNPRRSLTLAERDAVIAVCQKHRAGTWVLMMLMCGLRRGETIPLSWNDVNFETGMLTVDKSAEFISNVAHAKATKTNSGVRTIPIPPPLMVRLIAEKAENKSSLIFTPAKSDGMLTETNCKRLWSSFYRELDIAMGAQLYRNQIIKTSLRDGITPHALRHTFATDLFEMGVDLKTAQYLLGHADIKTTANIYTHMRDEMLSETQKKFEEFYERGTRGEQKRRKIL